MEGGSVGDLAGNLGVESRRGGRMRCWWRSGTSGAFAGCLGCGDWACCRSRQVRGEAKLCPAGTHPTPRLPRPSVAWVWMGQGAFQVFEFSRPIISDVCHPCAMNARGHLYCLEHTREERPSQMVTSGGPSQPVLVTDI